MADYEKLADSTVTVLNNIVQVEDYNKIAVAWTEGCNKLEELAAVEQLSTEDSTRMASAKDKVAAKFLEVQTVLTSRMLPQPAETVTSPTPR